MALHDHAVCTRVVQYKPHQRVNAHTHTLRIRMYVAHCFQKPHARHDMDGREIGLK